MSRMSRWWVMRMADDVESGREMQTDKLGYDDRGLPQDVTVCAGNENCNESWLFRCLCNACSTSRFDSQFNLSSQAIYISKSYKSSVGKLISSFCHRPPYLFGHVKPTPRRAVGLPAGTDASETPQRLVAAVGVPWIRALFGRENWSVLHNSLEHVGNMHTIFACRKWRCCIVFWESVCMINSGVNVFYRVEYTSTICANQRK